MNNLPSTYGNLIKKLEDRLDHTTDPLTMSVLRDEQFEKYEKIRKRRGFKSNKSDDSEEDEKRVMFVKNFKGRCHKYGKFGFKSVNCRSSYEKSIRGIWRGMLK